MRNSLYRLSLGAAALFLTSLPALAQFPDDRPDTVRFRLGGIFATLDTETQVSRPNAPGTGIDLTGLGLTGDTANTFRGEGYWNFAGRSYLDFGYVKLAEDGSKQITKDFVFNGLVYKAGAQVSAETDSRYIYAAYRYGIVKNPNVHLGLSLGISYTTLRAKLSATAGVQRPDGTVVQGGASTEREINAPVPLLGLDFEVRLASTLTLSARASGMAVTIDPYSGSLVEYAGFLNWYFGRNFGVGGGYEYQKLHIEKDESTPDAFRFDQKFDGPRVYLLLSF
jgi:hypothetical protein